MLLADLGADVVKVEPPEGDPTRLYGPPYAGPADPEAGYPGESGYYLSVNRNKRGIRLDLRTRRRPEVLRRLIERSDVLIENFRPGSLERLGFDDADLEALNPRLVHLSITGYGAHGPDRDKPGFDFIIQAVSGLMSITGQPDAEGGQPDQGRGRRRRPDDRDARRGRGARGAARHGMRHARAGPRPAHRHLAARRHDRLAHQPGHQPPRRRQGARSDGQPSPQHHALRDVLERRMARSPWPSARSDSGIASVLPSTGPSWPMTRVSSPTDQRIEARQDLRVILSQRFAERSTDAWVAELSAAEVPVGQIRDMAQVFADPQVRELGMVMEVEHPTIGTLRQTGIPWQMSGHPSAIKRAAPLLGQHQEEVLRELGYAPAQIARMLAGDAR